MKKIERMTRDTIAQALESELGQPAQKPVETSFDSSVKSQPKKDYTDKLSDAEIRDFFAPLGYISHSPIDTVDGESVEPFIVVECEDVVVMFNDFTTRVYEKRPDSSLAGYAELTNANIGQLVASQIATNLFGRKFPESYPRRKRDFDLANIEKSFKSLSPELKRFLGTAKEIQEANVKSTYNVNEYGAANIEDVPSNLRRD